MGVPVAQSLSDLSSITTRDLDVDPSEQETINFANAQSVAPLGDYTVLSVNHGFFFSTGISQNSLADGLTVTADYVPSGNDQNLYTGSSSSGSYSVTTDSGKLPGEGTVSGYTGSTYNPLSVGQKLALDACSTTTGTGSSLVNVTGTDTDKDGLCDRWEQATPIANNAPNDATHRYVTCPTWALTNPTTHVKFVASYRFKVSRY